VQTLYISRNSLESLDGLQQFPQLRVLSAGDNCISDLDQLALLKRACPVLEAANFEGNPISQLPHFR
jgi:Leucine-rich repeat (LRR) protein